MAGIIWYTSSILVSDFNAWLRRVGSIRLFVQVDFRIFATF